MNRTHHSPLLTLVILIGCAPTGGGDNPAAATETQVGLSTTTTSSTGATTGDGTSMPVDTASESASSTSEDESSTGLADPYTTTTGTSSESGASSSSETGSPQSDPIPSVCLTHPASKIIEFDQMYDGELEHTLSEEGLALDMRNARFEYDFIDTQRAVSVDGNLEGACIIGATVVGTQDEGLPWDEVKNTDGVRFIHRPESTGGAMTAEAVWVENVGDGFEPARYSGAAGLGYTWTLQHSYFRHIRDDVIENDACHAGRVEDVLVDDSFAFLSTRPGSGNHLDTGDIAPVIEVIDSLIHTATEELGGRPWKWPGSSSSCTPTPLLRVRDTVLRMDSAAGNLTFPEGDYENVTLVWLGGGEYPEPLPAGVIVTQDIEVWNDARAEWIERHECDAALTACARLVDPR